MRVKIYGPEREKLKKLIREKYFKLIILEKKSRTKPDAIICYGGDGTLLLAEDINPGIPKVSIRNSQICSNCRNESREIILQLLLQKKYYVTEHNKIQATCKGRTITALNDIVVGHYYINTALRFRVYVNDSAYGGEFLGDGVVAATTIGSTAYYQSITRSNFQEGIGLAFNNTVNSIGHVVLNDKCIIKVVITRGPGRLRYDNDRGLINLKTSDEIIIRKSNKIAKLINFYGKNKKYNIDISQNRLPLGYCQVCRKYYRE